jgi:hypothetical protein
MPSRDRRLAVLAEGGRRRRDLRTTLTELAEIMAAQTAGCSRGVPAHGRRVADLALALAEAAEREGVDGCEGSLPLSRADRESMILAAVIHGIADGERETGASPGPRLGPDAMAALEYRMRWIRDICRHRAVLRSVYDGGGFYPPGDPAGLPPMDYALRATEIEGFLGFLEQMNQEGPSSDEEREALASIARRSLEVDDGPPIPYLTEAEHAALATPAGLLGEQQRDLVRERRERLREHLRAVSWPEALGEVPGLVEALHGGQEAPTGLPARLLLVADHWDRLMRCGEDSNGLPAGRVLSSMKAEAELGRLDRELVAVLERSGLLPEAPEGGKAAPLREDPADLETPLH